MGYEEAEEFIYGLAPSFQQVGRRAYKAGMGNTLELDRHLGHPHRKYGTIHVGGTNGKGSTAHTLAAILQAAGYRVGLYTSPHLLSLRERVRIDGQEMEKAAVAEFVEREKGLLERMRPSFFELTTAMALDYFARRDVDVAVVEVGLGGRLDCTNVLEPLVAVITNIGLDHTDLLGHTLGEIAAEKAGIIKRKTPVVVGKTTEETLPVFRRKAEEMGAPLWLAYAPSPLSGAERAAGKPGWIYTLRDTGERIYGELGGECQKENAATILKTVEVLRGLPEGKRLKITDGDVRKGFAEVCSMTGLRGRWETMGESPKVVCDTGHNADAFKYIVEQLEGVKAKNLRIVMGMVSDKDYRTVVGMLPRRAKCYFARATTRRSLGAEALAEVARERGMECETFGDVGSAYRKAMEEAEREDFIFVGGSTYVVADLLDYLRSRTTKS